MRVGEEMKKRARRADLAAYLSVNYPETVKIVSGKLRSVEHNSLYISAEYGYHRFSNGEHGNAIDYLMRYLNKSFVDAVIELQDYSADPGFAVNESDKACLRKKQAHTVGEKRTSLPKKSDSTVRVCLYLTQQRKLDEDTVGKAMETGTLYQDDHGNCVFASPSGDYAEIKGTVILSGGKTFKQECSRSPGSYWVFDPGHDKVFVCESAIDALSLFEMEGPGYSYASMGGLKSNRLTKIRKDYKFCVIAVDNDPAGDAFVERNCPDLPRLKSFLKDWNDDLKSKKV